MRIARVKLTGFKSFVDPVELRILPGLTGVVGPNGCGKSNLLEAIRWVMGEGSPKSLRSAAMDDVIFAGTASRPQRQFAQVSILAEREDDEVEVVRRIERGAGSAYRINGRDARARDAQLIFADAATGAHSPALVSQGRIGAIIAARPAERRQMLEEAAGISGLHVRRREAEIRLRATEANLSRAEELVAELDARIVVLRRQARSAERYRKLSDEIRMAEARLIYARWRDAAAAAETARAEARTADEAVFAASEAQRAAAAWSNEAVGVLAASRGAAQVARDEAADARHRLATVQAERAQVDAQLSDLAAQHDRLTQDRAREGELARDAGDALSRLSAEVAALDLRLSQAAEARPAAVQALADAEQESRAAEIALARTLADAARDAAERRVAEAALAVAAARMERANAALAAAIHAQIAIGDIKTIEAARDQALAVRQSAQAAASAALQDIEAAELKRAEAVAVRATAETEASTAAAFYAALDAEAKALRRDVGTTTGALADVRADPGYEVALAAALGDDLTAELGPTGLRRWSATAGNGSDPSLAVGAPLSDHVTAPPQLFRRLAQIAVVDVDRGEVLAVGQRMVTRDGVMRRWDGYVTEGAGAATAEGLKRRNKLLEVEAKLPAAQTAARDAVERLSGATLTVVTSGDLLDEARQTREKNEAAWRLALRAEDQAGIALDRAGVQSIDAQQRRAVAQVECDAATSAQQDAAATLAALPVSASQDSVSALDLDARSAREAAAGLRAMLVSADGHSASDADRRSAALAEVADWRARSGKAGKRVEEMSKRAVTLEQSAHALASLPAQLNAQAAMIGIEAARLADAADVAVQAERAADAGLRLREEAATNAGEGLSTARELRAGAQARMENQDLRRVEMGRVAGERFECPAAILPEKIGFDPDSIAAATDESLRLERVTMERERLGPVNLVAESELAELESGRSINAAEVSELTEAVHRLRGSIGSLNREGRMRLRTAFEAVNGHFRSLFGTLFNGGEAHLALIDSDDPLEAGLEIMAQPPGKKLSSLTLLSGGEQALTAVALIFALFLTNPAPLCVLDEVDAPLDDANVERFCDLLDAMTRDTATRYLIVTHNAVTMSRMHRLYGVTMVEQGVSRLVSVDLGAAEALLAAE